MTNIDIEVDLDMRISERVEETHFQSVEEYVNFVLREALSDTRSSSQLSEADNNDLQNQLEDLGYL